MNSFISLQPLLPIFAMAGAIFFLAGIVSTTAITATAEAPALGRHFVFTIQLEKC